MEITKTRRDRVFQVIALVILGSLAWRASSEYRATAEAGSGLMTVGWVLWTASVVLPGSGLGRYFNDRDAKVRYKARALGALNIACMVGGLLCVAAGYFLSFTMNGRDDG